MVDLDLERWHRLRLAEANEADNGPTFIQVQEAAARRARARDQLTRFRAQDLKGTHLDRRSPVLTPGERILPGVGGHDHNDIDRAFQSSVHELEARVAAAESETIGFPIAASVRRASRDLRRLVEACRTWANEQARR